MTSEKPQLFAMIGLPSGTFTGLKIQIAGSFGAFFFTRD